MSGDDVKRYCGKCRLYVWNFAELTTDEARALLIETQGRLCGRIFTRPDGTVLTKDCPTGVAMHRRKRVGGMAVAAALLGGAVTGIGASLVDAEGCALTSGNSPGMMMGDISPARIPSGNPPGE